MKLNAATQLLPIGWAALPAPPVLPPPRRPARGMVADLEQYLCEITGFSGMSLQPNSGAKANTPVCSSFGLPRRPGNPTATSV